MRFDWIAMRIAIFALLLASLAVGCRSAGDFPNRPITLICPWSVGGGTDRITRQIASQLERELGVPVNVVNASGGAGVTGHTRGALARPDGYTMTMITSELNMLHWRGLTNITHRDFRPLMRVNRDYAALFVREDAPWLSVDDLENTIRDNPRSLRAAGTAFGGIWHVALAGWLIHGDMNPTDVVWISLNGSAPSLQELMAGGVEIVSCSVPEARSLLDAGRIRCLTVMSEERLPSVSDVPTLAETGSDWTTFTWRGLALPRGVAEERAAILENAVRRVVTSDEFRQFCERAGFGWTGDGPEEFRVELAREDAQFGEIFQSAAFQSVRSQTFGPWLFPIVIGSLLILALTASILTHTRTKTKRISDVSRARLLTVAGSIGAVISYILLAEHLGYVVTTALNLFALFLLLRVRVSVAALTAVIFSAVSYHLFGVVLRVPLPWGVLGW
jgi:tripartite-type tricarboxylate transporter receptor subunit TctC